MNEFNTIMDKTIVTEIIEKKSRFIASLFYIEEVEKAEEKIKQIKKKYYDAKHNCFAYLIFNNGEIYKKCSDDGEPSGTAGIPMLDILEKKKIYNVLIIVTRYFGGVLLGTGGLVRAYSQALKQALENTTIICQEPGYQLNVEIIYSELDKFKYYCNKNNINIIDYTYTSNIVCKIEVNEEEKNRLIEEKEKENKLKILNIDIIRHMNILKLSNNVN